MYIGNYLIDVVNDEVILPFALDDGIYDLFCVKDTANDIMTVISPVELNYVEKYGQYGEIVYKSKVHSDSRVDLPQVFVEYINHDSQVRIYGCGDRVEIFPKNPDTIQPLGKEEILELIKKLDNKFM